MRLEVALALAIGGDLRHLAEVARQLDYLGLEVELGGPVVWGNAEILGKGANGVVVLCRRVQGGGRLACKIRRGDAQRSDLLMEAFFLSLANGVSVGPKLFAYSKDVIAMEYVEGVPLAAWWRSADPKSKSLVLSRLLDQAFALDELGLAHAELSRPGEHVVVVGDKPVILDFESARFGTARNVPQVANMSRALGLSPPLDLLRAYKSAPSRQLLEDIKRSLLSQLER